MSRPDSVNVRPAWFPKPGVGYNKGLLLFRIGDGVESGYLSRYLVDRVFSQENVALIFTVYGLTAAAAWLSGALSDLGEPCRVMWAGLGIWTVFETAFLLPD